MLHCTLYVCVSRCVRETWEGEAGREGGGRQLNGCGRDHWREIFRLHITYMDHMTWEEAYLRVDEVEEKYGDH